MERQNAVYICILGPLEEPNFAINGQWLWQKEVK